MKDELNFMIPEAERREIESLYRSGKKQASVAEPLMCRWGLHRWSKWWTIHKAAICGDAKPEGGYWHEGNFVEQKRFCLNCYLTTFRKAEVK